MQTAWEKAVRTLLRGLIDDAKHVDSASSIEDLSQWIKANGSRAAELLVTRNGRRDHLPRV